ncbi:Splicing factor YJU2 [Penicillium macrosclerotiorum]|uniref:Splicing factor YJU2 n=1 Tax=Penicillium macrosclerotiorum TaxID=303699 RepID=UPI002548AB14|nr:Splicing factor YJU2 [Penicillium macrosclerotiorum]KAJ5669886.1 Splicing factor YJU2 [Penicillium macrosclerotiorum]
MSERKVLTKYYPPDFDPSAIGRTPKHLRQKGPKVITVRLMAPFSMKCTNCGEYIYRGRKFNARKQTLEEKYLSIPIYRFYIRCTRCSGEITFRTDPKNMDYECEKGAKRNFEPWRDAKSEKYKETEAETLDRLEREENEEQEQLERDKMAELEEKMQDSKREMAIADALDEIRTRNARIARSEMKGDEGALDLIHNELDEDKLQQDMEDEETARKAFMTASGERVKRIVDEEEPAPTGPSEAKPLPTQMPPPSTSFARVKRPKKAGVSSLGIKKKPSLV